MANSKNLPDDLKRRVDAARGIPPESTAPKSTASASEDPLGDLKRRADAARGVPPKSTSPKSTAPASRVLPVASKLLGGAAAALYPNNNIATDDYEKRQTQKAASARMKTDKSALGTSMFVDYATGSPARVAKSVGKRVFGDNPPATKGAKSPYSPPSSTSRASSPAPKSSSSGVKRYTKADLLTTPKSSSPSGISVKPQSAQDRLNAAPKRTSATELDKALPVPPKERTAQERLDAAPKRPTATQQDQMRTPSSKYTPFQQAFKDARAAKKKEFEFNTKRYNTRRKDGK